MAFLHLRFGRRLKDSIFRVEDGRVLIPAAAAWPGGILGLFSDGATVHQLGGKFKHLALVDADDAIAAWEKERSPKSAERISQLRQLKALALKEEMVP